MKLPNNLPLGPGQSAIKEISLRFSTADEVMQELVESKGYTPFAKPNFECPVLTPEMLTTTDSRSYSTTYSMFKAYWDYYREALAIIEGRVLQYKNMLAMVEVQTKKILREVAETSGEKLTVEKLKERVLENPEYQDVLLKLQRHTQEEKLIESKFEVLDMSMKVISRQVEIRKLDLEQSMINHHMPFRGQPPRNL